MDKRSVRALLVSLVIHLVLVLLLPGLGSIELTEPTQSSLKVNLSTATPQPESETPKPEPSKTTQTAPPSPEEGTESEEAAAEVETQQAEQSPKQSPTEPSAKDKTEPPTREQPTEQAAQPGKTGTESEPSLLKRGGNFPRLASASEPSGGSPERSPLSQVPTPKYEVQASETPTDTGSWELKIREPSAPDEPAPEQKVTFEMNISKQTEDLEMEDYVRPRANQPMKRGPSREVLHRPLPEIPRWLERTGEEVQVSVHFRINEAGRVKSMEILSSSGYTALDDRVLQAVRRWRYEPGPGVEDHVVLFRFELTPRGRSARNG